ncbi:hypothetical protein HOT13_gp23 [Enterobacteria phage vB_EcoS_IME18]|uniref:Uncharacterized protein n=1 Tax=Enterobacteria phage vB_EcoS_IME18 TaxID=2163886 RepID=A0A2S1GNB5_9CAUD|nr:hypothetical protein HOT13_gp23 [Enterobacteria phage vB_EcoS_IME18]AWD90874.1 hypothetical protein [Enterobacteria phage vB_EcoS_IME18]
MLKLEDVKFPIKFISLGCGEITFTSEDKGKCATDEVSQLKLDWFINRHNEVNPENSAKKDYHYIISGSQDVYGKCDGWKTDRSIFNTAKPEIKPMLQCTQIENMPLSATIKGVQLDSESWTEITATPKTIEVHDDVVILLLHYGSFKHKTVSGEISIKRGTLVRYEVK